MGMFDVLSPKPEPSSDPWEMVRGSADGWDLEAMFAAYRGGPISAVPHVTLATPAYNPPCLEFLQARDLITRDLVEHGIDHTILTSPGDSLVMRGRHTLMHEFMTSAATHLVFWDADIEPLDPTIVRQMLATGHDIVGGACPFRGATGRVVCNLREEDKTRGQIESDEMGCVPVAEVGTGFLMMSRAAIIRLCTAHPELLYFSDLASAHGKPMWALFDTVIEGRRFLSEDYFFCKLWRDLGESVYVYVPFEARHWGREGFRATFQHAWRMREAGETQGVVE